MSTIFIAPCPKCGTMVQASVKGQLCAGCGEREAKKALERLRDRDDIFNEVKNEVV